MLPNSSINLALKLGSLMLVKDSLLFNRMAWSISTSSRGWLSKLSVEQAVGLRGGQWGSGGGGSGGVEDLHGKFVGGMEVGAVIQHEVHVRIYGNGVLIVGSRLFENFVFQYGIL